MSKGGVLKLLFELDGDLLKLLRELCLQIFAISDDSLDLFDLYLGLLAQLDCQRLSQPALHLGDMIGR